MNEHEKGQVATSAAEVYEQFFIPALFAEWPPRLLAAANVQPGQAVLDVACGTGVLARAAAQKVGEAGRVVGLDINEGMLAVARQKAPSITWKVGPAEELPFADNSFDGVVSQFGLMFFEDPARALAEMNRVLRPKGQTAVAVWDSLAATPGYALVAEMLDELFGPEAAQSIQMPYSLGDTEKLASLFTAAGLNDFSIQTVPGKACFPSVEDWIYTDIKGWTLADIVDEEGYERFRRYALPKLARFVQADGSVAFDAPAHIVTVPAQ
ncbi:MAG: methyltransferase domain-containing protein [Ardenticatenaceae bacterium]|nr:methyltransferase domain-containing protein [Ardenticatenaceae bacterium]MCB8988327.1 methyltransferase domain-containing protein [Ardenticatenaceae bacterium]